jgi:hypothetical protein
MTHLLVNLVYLLSRYLHIVCATLLVGGTLFYEMVVPEAIAELRDEHRLAIFARARWFFRRIVWLSSAAIILTGIIESAHHWPTYTHVEAAAMAAASTRPVTAADSIGVRPGWWWAAHASTGIIAVLIAISLTAGPRPPEHPVRWMRLNLGILLIVIFLATATRQVRLIAADQAHSTATRAAARAVK